MTDNNRLDSLIVADARGTITHCVAASASVLGYEAEALVGQSINVLIPRSDAVAHNGYMARYIETGTMRALGKARMLQARHREGHLVSVIVAVTALKFGGEHAFAALIRDQVSEREVDALQRRRDELVVQARVNDVLQRAESVESMLDGVLGALISMPEMVVENKAGVFLLEDVPPEPERPGRLPILRPKQALRLVHTVGAFSDTFLEAEAWVPLGGCLCGRAALSGEVIISANCFHDPRHEYVFEKMKAHGHYIIPLKHQDQICGVVFLYTAPEPDASQDRVLLLETIGSQIGLGLRRLKADARMAKLALEDSLTGALNRRAVLGRLAQERSRAKRAPGPVSVIMVDIDHFKRVNDTFGHPVGDGVITAVTRRLQAAVRLYDVVGRYGGEEFLVVLPECGLSTARLVAERMRTAIFGEPVETGGHVLTVSASLGVASTADVEISDEALIAAADTALYAAKAGGRNRVEVGAGP